MKQVVLSGATGFLGRALVDRMLADGRCRVTAAVRCADATMSAAVRTVAVGEIDANTDWSGALVGAEVVVHCAARVHVMREVSGDPLEAFRRVNRDGTLAFARQAVRAGVRRFVFISTIGVNGAETGAHPFNADDPAAPHSPYAVSKHEAETGLLQIACETGMEVVVIRPPLVYGPGAPGNFHTMVKWLSRGVPLPLGAVANNMRSYVALDNLVDFIVRCLEHPAAANRIFLVSDGEDVSTTDFLRRTAFAMGKRARLLPVPTALLWLGARILGKPELAQRLCGSLRIDASAATQVLGWQPVISMDEGLKRAVKGCSS